MKLVDLATINTNYIEADFWLIRRGGINRCGEPTRQFNPEHIGIKVLRIDVLLPHYLFYVLVTIHQQKHWERLATGSLKLVNIRVEDVKNIKLSAT